MYREYILRFSDGEACIGDLVTDGPQGKSYQDVIFNGGSSHER